MRDAAARLAEKKPGQPVGLRRQPRNDDLPGQGPEAVKIEEEFPQRLLLGVVQGRQVEIAALAHPPAAHREKGEERFPPQEAGGDARRNRRGRGS